ncbi:sulfite exporter TauE/SafE family protein [Solimicrobium silvestre]|nr:TSUP family transporter [Solimicrobium silvestre]
MTEYLILCIAAFSAGLIDAVVGGGGLINVPAIFSTFPNGIPATLLGTNKLGGIWGTAAAAVNYARVVKIIWNVAISVACAVLVFSFIGAYTVTRIPSDFLRKCLPLILVMVAIYTFKRKNFGQSHTPFHTDTKERTLAFSTGAGIGFYDGFFGPGTGSFLIFVFVRFFGFDFLTASAISKIVNVACNGAALLLFGISGHVMWAVGFTMAVFGVAGSLVGTRLAIKNGSGFVRKLFLCIVVVLIIKTSYDAFLR